MRPEHKAYLAQVAERIAFAGPLMHDDGETMIGSLLAIDFDSRDAAQAWLADEPFTRAGLYADVEDPRLRQPVAAACRLPALTTPCPPGDRGSHTTRRQNHVQTLR